MPTISYNTTPVKINGKNQKGKVRLTAYATNSSGERKKLESKIVTSEKSLKSSVDFFRHHNTFKNMHERYVGINRQQIYDYSKKPKEPKGDKQYKVGAEYKNKWVWGFSSFESKNHRAEAKKNFFDRLSAQIIGYSDDKIGQKEFRQAIEDGRIKKYREGWVSHSDI